MGRAPRDVVSMSMEVRSPICEAESPKWPSISGATMGTSEMAMPVTTTYDMSASPRKNAPVLSV